MSCALGPKTSNGSINMNERVLPPAPFRRLQIKGDNSCFLYLTELLAI